MPRHWLVSIIGAALVLAAASPRADAKSVAELEEFLGRARTYTEADRRAVLKLIEADVPDAKGRFKPTRKGQKKTDENLDWLDALSKLPKDTRALDEVVADVEAIRALAASHDADAGRAVLDFAFSEIGLVYRDECGRYLRNMSPYSVPALIISSKIKKRASSKRRYARYQLERMDREHPLKAIRYAPTEIKIAILAAYQKVLHREAVLPVLLTTNDVSPAVRAQARSTWMSYVTGPPPPEAPKKKLALPGGKLTDDKMPLFLNHRQLARIFMHRTYEEATGQKPARGTKLADLSEQLFELYDQRRAQAYGDDLDGGIALAGEGKPREAAVLFDAILGAEPQFARRAEMASGYAKLGDELKTEKKWREAAVAFSKAHAVAPDGAHAQRALAEQYYTEGRTLSAAGSDPTAAFRKAVEHDPEHKGATAALAGDDPDAAEAGGNAKPKWVFYAGVGSALFALLLLILATRRRHS